MVVGACGVVSGVVGVVDDVEVVVGSVTDVGLGVVVVFFEISTGNDGTGLLIGKSVTESANISEKDRKKRILIDIQS